MASEQATAAAEELECRFLGYMKGSNAQRDVIKQFAAIIDAAFAPVVSLLRESRHLLWHHHIGEGCQERIDALIGKEES